MTLDSDDFRDNKVGSCGFQGGLLQELVFELWHGSIGGCREGAGAKSSRLRAGGENELGVFERLKEG